MNAIMAQVTKGHMRLIMQTFSSRQETRLNDTYEQAMMRIQNADNEVRNLAKKALIWVVHARRPLSYAELEVGLAVRRGEQFFDPDFFPSPRVLHIACGGLLTIDSDSDHIQLVHPSLEDYFHKTWQHWFPKSHEHFADICITYLVYDAFETGLCPTEDDFAARLKGYALYDYAARNWGHFARSGNTEVDKIPKLLKIPNKVAAASQAMVAWRDRPRTYGQKLETCITGAHLAAYFGLKDSMDYLCQDKDAAGRHTNIDSRDAIGQTPLSWAAQNNREEVVQSILEANGVAVNSQDDWGNTPISWAARKGYLGVVQILLKAVDINLGNFDGKTPLLLAAQEGHEAVVDMLLGTPKIQIESSDKWDESPLSSAVKNGHQGVFNMLVSKSPNCIDKKEKKFGRSPLSWACEFGHEEIAKTLLHSDKVDANSEDKKGKTPLWYATKHGSVGLVRLLYRKHKEDPEKEAGSKIPLQLAKENGHEEIVRILEATRSAKF